MSFGQVTALIAGALLLLPGGCFLFFGVMFFGESQFAIFALIWLAIGGGIVWVAVTLFRFAFRRRRI